MKGGEFELMACPIVSSTDRSRRKTRLVSQGLINETTETLEKEADGFQIRWEYLPDPREIARVVLRKEAA